MDTFPLNGRFSEKDYKRKLSEGLFALLKENGFKKLGTGFTKENNDLVYFIQIQSSRSSTADVCKLTVNIGIFSQKIFALSRLSKPDYLSHWFKRIGFYGQQPMDKWWIVSDWYTTEQAFHEISGLLITRVLPDIYTFQTTDDLAAFWLAGNYQGLTKGQQDDYLKLLGR